MSSPLARKRRKANATGRSVGGERHVRLHHWMMKSAAWQELSLAGRCLLIELYALFNGENNGDLFLSQREAASRLQINKDTAGKLLKELQDRGFIRARQGGSFHYKERHATAWVLTEFAFAGQLPTKEFMRWRPGDTSKVGPTEPDRLSDQTGQKVRKRAATIRICPTEPDRNTPDPPSNCPTRPDTDSLPPGERPDERTDQPSTTPTEPELQPPAEGRDETHAAVPPAPHQRQGAVLPRPKPPVPLRPMALPIGPATAAAMQAKVGREQQPVVVPVPPAPVSAITHDPRQLDLVTFVEQQTGKPTSAVAPVDQLRADLARHLDNAPRGEVKRIAAVLGLSGPQISNFKAGRFNLNSTAEAVLRQYLHEASPGGARRIMEAQHAR